MKCSLELDAPPSSMVLRFSRHFDGINEGDKYARLVGLTVRYTSYSVMHAILRSFAPARLGWLSTLGRSARIVRYSRLGGFTIWVERSDNRYSSTVCGYFVNDIKSASTAT